MVHPAPGLVCLAALAACGSPSGPPPPPPPTVPSIRAVHSPAPSDTISGFFGGDSLVIEVRGANGLPAANTKVDFGSTTVTPGTSVDLGFATQFTDPQGLVRVSVRAGPVAGAFRLLFFALNFTVTDSVTFTILPGAPASVTIDPAYVLVAVGGSQSYTRTTLDRGGNLLAPVPTLVPFGEITVNGATVTATGPGNYQVEARAAGLSATATIDVVPVGKVVYRSVDGDLVTRNLDGSGLSLLMHGGSSPVWMVDGSVLAIGTDFRPVRIVPGSPAGPQPFLAADAPIDLLEVTWPTVSPDGRYVYFLAARLGDFVSRVWRTSVDGTGTVALNIPEPIIQYSVSPDPQVVAYHTGARAPGRVYNLTTGAFFDFPPFKHFPWWSPQGDLVAFGTGDHLGIDLYTADGQFVRTLRPERYFESIWLSWSGDGRYILGHDGGAMRLVDLTNGSLVTLPFGAQLIGSSIRVP